MAISAKDVMALRKKTNLGMMECKKALEATNGDTDAAIALLKEKLGNKMETRSDREAAEGVIAVAKGDGAIAIVELDCETDFVARNEDFLATCDKVAALVLEGPAGALKPNDEIKAVIDEVRITTQENVQLRAGHKYEGAVVGSYVHHNKKVGVIIVGEGELPADLTTGICQHIAASVPPPLAVDQEGLPAADVEAKKAEAIAEAEASGKPAEIAEKIATGKLRKWVDDNTLLGQVYLREMDAKKPVRHYLPKGSKITGFVRLSIAD